MIILSRFFIYLLYIIFFVIYSTTDSVLLLINLYFWYVILWGPLSILFLFIFYYYRVLWPFFFLYYLLCYFNKFEYKGKRKFFRPLGYSLVTFKHYIYLLKIFFFKYLSINIYLYLFLLNLFISIYIFKYINISIFLITLININIFIFIKNYIRFNNYKNLIDLDTLNFKLKKKYEIKFAPIMFKFLFKKNLFKEKCYYFFFNIYIYILLWIIVIIYIFILVLNFSFLQDYIYSINFPFLKKLRLMSFDIETKDMSYYLYCFLSVRKDLYFKLKELLIYFDMSKIKDINFKIKELNFNNKINFLSFDFLNIDNWNINRAFYVRAYRARTRIFIPFDDLPLSTRIIINYFHVDFRLFKFMYKEMLNYYDIDNINIKDKEQYRMFIYAIIKDYFNFIKIISIIDFLLIWSNIKNKKHFEFFIDTFFNFSDYYYIKHNNITLEKFIVIYKKNINFYSSLKFMAINELFISQNANSTKFIDILDDIWNDETTIRDRQYKQTFAIAGLKEYIIEEFYNMEETRSVVPLKYRDPINYAKDWELNLERYPDITELNARLMTKTVEERSDTTITDSNVLKNFWEFAKVNPVSLLKIVKFLKDEKI